MGEVVDRAEQRAEEARDRLKGRSDEVRRDLWQVASEVAIDNIRDIDVENDQATIKTDLGVDQTKQARELCDAAIAYPVLSVDKVRVEGKHERILAECREI